MVTTVRTGMVCLLLAACSLDSVEIGELHYDRGQPVIEAPTRSRVGDPVPVTVSTVGGGCQSLESTEIVATEDGGELTPYDRDSDRSTCTTILKIFRHEGVFTFETPGTKTINVHGRRLVANGIDDSRYELVTIPVRIIIE